MPRIKSFNLKKSGPGRNTRAKPNSVSGANAEVGKQNLNATRRKNIAVGTSYQKDENTDLNQHNGNCIMNINFLSQALNQFVRCKFCDATDSITCYEDISSPCGLASNIVLHCSQCQIKASFHTSEKIEQSYAVNLQFFYALRCIGKGEAAGKTFCAIMNLPSTSCHFQRATKQIFDAVELAAKDSMKTAIAEAIHLNDGSTDLTAALDGTWQKRGHSSLNCVVSATNIENGKVIDVECITKYCATCVNIKNESKLNAHRESLECAINYMGSSGGMEAQGAKSIFARSHYLYGVRYTKYLGDGDSKGFLRVIQSNPYGHQQVEKLECIAHVCKRMGSRLRRLKIDYKGKKLSDGKHLSGKNRLTDREINNLQIYYGMAIRDNTQSVKDMQRGIWAIYFHKVSTDEDPHHELCPSGKFSWCKFNRSKITNETYTHKHSLPLAVAEVLKPIFRSLADPALLEKCLHGRTQNPNESFNNVIWNRLPKTVFVGLKTLQVGVYDAVLTFNEGNCARIKVLEHLGINPGYNVVSTLKRLDFQRSAKADLAIKMSAKCPHKKRKSETNDMNCDDPEYGYGMG